MVYQTEYPLQGNCKSVIEASIMVKSVHEEDVSSRKVGSYRMVFGALRSHMLQKLTAPWRA